MLFRRRERTSASDDDEKASSSSSGGENPVIVKHRMYGLVLDAYTEPGEACFVRGKGRLSLPGLAVAAGRAMEELVRATERHRCVVGERAVCADDWGVLLTSSMVIVVVVVCRGSGHGGVGRG